MLPRDIESRLRTAHGDAECGTVNRLEPIAITLSQLAIEAFGDIDTGCRAPKALIRRHPQTPRPSRAVSLELDDKEWIYQVLTVGCHLIPHRAKLSLLSVRK